jgi:hypothetical protein
MVARWSGEVAVASSLLAGRGGRGRCSAGFVSFVVWCEPIAYLFLCFAYV